MKRCLAGLVAVVGVVGPWFVAPAIATAAPASVCAASATTVSVAVIVDFGDGSPVSAVCVPAGSTDNGAAVLGARAQQLGTAPPRFDQSSGLLCAIDGVPQTGCGDQVGSKYAYWSYWHGTSSGWSYSSVGPGGSRARSTTAEGWRFNPQGAGNPSDPPPGGSPDPAATCLAEPPPPPTSSPAAGSTQGSGSSSASSTATTASGDSSTTTTPSSTSSSSASSSASITTTTGSVNRFVRVSEKEGGSSVWPAVGAGGAIVALGAGGVVMSRRRRSLGP